MEHRSAVVVGGASGIGWATCRRLADDGWTVTVADLDGAAAVARADELGTPHRGAAADVTDEPSVGAALAGAGPLDLVVNSAGSSTLGRVEELDVAEFRRVVDVCLTGSFVVIKQAAAHLRDGGAVVTVASLNARQPGTGMAAYCAAKAGSVMLSQVAALELARRGIRVTTVSPGLVPTPLTAPALELPGIEDDYLANTPLGRSGTAEEVADAIVWVAAAPWVTGENIDINGGAHLMRYPDLHGHVVRAMGGEAAS